MSSLPAELFAAGGGFRPDPRFGATPVPPPVEKTVADPVETAFDDGYAKGFEDAAAQAAAQAKEADAARARIESAFERLDEAEGLKLEQRLRETILMLCEETLAPLTTDPDALAGRVAKALALLRRSTDEQVVRLHPDDLALIADRLADGIRTEADPAMVRGELRVETADGGLEEGPEQWRRTLSEALGLVEA